MELENKSMQVLVAIYNALSDVPATMKTFSQRSKAVVRILKLAEAQGIDMDKHFDEEGNVRKTIKAVAFPVVVAPTEKPKAKDKPAVKKAPAEPKTPPKKQIPAESVAKGPSIRSVAEALLLEVVSVDDNKRNVGIGYEDIIAKIKVQFPTANTTVACLRWYAVHMRERDIRVPNRPRATPKKEA